MMGLLLVAFSFSLFFLKKRQEQEKTEQQLRQQELRLLPRSNRSLGVASSDQISRTGSQVGNNAPSRREEGIHDILMMFSTTTENEK
jgi:hypothetical protein